MLQFTLSILLVVIIGTNENIDVELVEGNNKFGYDLNSELYVDSATNTFISPFSITSGFALIYPGSNGNTQSQIADVMGYPSCSLSTSCTSITQQYFNVQSSIKNTYNGMKRDDNYGSIVGIANKIYSSDALQIKQTYIDAITSDTGESFIDYNFDFFAMNATQLINDWVYDNTDGLIDQILSENDDISQWKLAVLNAIYLNATFSLSFPSSMTSLQPFYSDVSRTEKVADCHLMHQKQYFSYYDDGNYQFVKILFDDLDHDLFMLLALSLKEDINTAIKDQEYIKTAISNLEKKYVALALPKMSIDVKYELQNKILPDLGIIDAFDAAKANLSGVAENDNLALDRVIHKTTIKMDESGLLAAAVTLISIIPVSGTVNDPILFKVDHSFEMFIVDGKHDNIILFMGHIGNPGIPEGSNTPTFSEKDDDVWNVDTAFIVNPNIVFFHCLFIFYLSIKL